MTVRSGRAAIRMAGLAVLLACVTSGCVSLQATGPVTSVTEQDEGSSQIQIWPSPPSPNEAPSAIVAGFLEAAHSGAANQSIADKYLTTDMQKRWESERDTVIVLADDSESYPQPPGQNSADQSASGQDETASVEQVPEAGQNAAQSMRTDTDIADSDIIEVVQGAVIGTVDSSGLYSAAASTGTYGFGLTQTKSGYRISALPANFGVLMERTDFESSYDRHDVYYQNAQSTGRLIPTQVYLPETDTDQQVAEALAGLVVHGVPDQLGSASQDAVQGADFSSVRFGDDGAATVTIDSHGYCVKSSNACEQLGRQLAATLNSLSTKVTTVAVVDQANHHQYPPATAESSAFTYGLSQGSRSAPTMINAIGDDGQVEQIALGSSVNVSTVTYGDGKTKFKQIAVAPGQQNGRAQQVALVSQDGTKVYVPRRTSGQDELTQVYPSSGAPGGTVGRLSWDTDGDLWFTVVLNGVTSVYRYGQDTLSGVTLSGVDGTVTQVAAAPDGARVAVGYTSGGEDWIAVASAASDAEGGWDLRVGPNPVLAAAGWNQINDFGWYNEESLAVLGVQENSQVLGLYQVYADGSSVYDSLTEQPVEASPPGNAQDFAWNSGGQPIAAARNTDGKHLLYALSVEGQDAQLLGKSVTGTSPSY